MYTIKAGEVSRRADPLFVSDRHPYPLLVTGRDEGLELADRDRIARDREGLDRSAFVFDSDRIAIRGGSVCLDSPA